MDSLYFNYKKIKVINIKLIFRVSANVVYPEIFNF